MRHKFVFIGGLHRSGTTLLFRILRDHPMISGFNIENGAEREHEGQYLQSVFPPDPNYGGVGYFAFDDSAHLTQESELVTENNRVRLFGEWARHWDLSKGYLLEKSPPNLIQTRFLQALFPNSYFIIIVRHPIATSLATLKWMGWPRYIIEPRVNRKSKKPDYNVRITTQDEIGLFQASRQLYTESMLYSLLLHWKVSHHIFLHDTIFLNRFMMIRYEDLVENPDRQMQTICSFLNIPEFKSPTTKEITNQNTPYFDQLKSLKESELSPGGRAFIEDSFQNDFQQFGYSLTALNELGSCNDIKLFGNKALKK